MAGQKNDAAAGEEKEERVVKHTVKDSVFTSLLRKKISDTAVSGTSSRGYRDNGG